MLEIALVVWGLKGASSSAAANATHTTLQNLTNMSEELNRKNKLAGFEGPPTANPTSPIYPIPAGGIGGEVAPTLVTSDSRNSDRLGPAVQRTAEVMRRLSSIPDNKKVLEKLPGDQLLTVPQSSTWPAGTVVLDGWRDPILFCPSSGLQNVASKDPKLTTWSSSANYSRGARVVSNGVYYTAIESNTGSSPPDPKFWFRGIRSPDGRSFWASAGADGNFQIGDDNVYSFEH